MIFVDMNSKIYQFRPSKSYNRTDQGDNGILDIYTYDGDTCGVLVMFTFGPSQFLHQEREWYGTCKSASLNKKTIPCMYS